ncbi:MAG: methyltransferase [Solirubrobacterales bacterium]|nr:methyltransferase [Solirubrobacterales bacterium]
MTPATVDQSADPQELIRRVLFSFWLSRAVWLAARLRLADAIGAGPTPTAEIARLSGTDPESCKRLLDALAAAGLLRSDERGRYGPTPASDLLRSDHPRSQRGLIDVLLGGEQFEAWGALETSLRTGRPAFDVRHGASWIDYYNAHPDAGRAFAEAMSGTTRAFEDAILEADPFGDFSFAVDVGGSHGSLLRRLLERNAEARGVVLDLPEVIAGLATGGDLGDRFTAVEGDFFEAVPAGGDLYLLKLILHDWDDERAEAILRRVREALGPGGSVAIIETVLPESPAERLGSAEHPGWLMDLNMLAMTGGRERTAPAFASLLEGAGWRLERIVPTRSPISVVLASGA